MICLHCGKQLALFKKLREDAFCSAEHREAFFESHQRLALERLKSSAARLKARRYAILHPPADPEPAFCGFLSQIVTFEPQSWVGAAHFDVALGSFETSFHPPVLELRPESGARYCGLTSLPFPHPASSGAPRHELDVQFTAWNSRLAHLIAGYHWQQAAPGLASAIRAKGVRLAQGETATLQRTEADPASLESKPGVPAWNAPQATAAVSVESRMLRLGAPPAANFEGTHNTEASGALAHNGNPAVPARVSPSSDFAPELVSRLFRAKPRAGVDDSSVSEFESIPATAETTPSTPAILPTSLSGTGVAGPGSSRWIGTKKAGPVEGKTAEMTKGAIESLNGKSATPRVQGATLGQTSFVPLRAERFFKARPQAPVQGLSIPGWEPIDSVALDWAPKAPSVEDVSTPAQVPDVEPEFLDRVYRMRPRGPVPDRTPLVEPQSHAIAPVEPAVFSAVPLLPVAALPVVEAEPVPASRMFRPRPKQGIESESVQSFVPIAAEPIQSGTEISRSTQEAGRTSSEPAREVPLPQVDRLEELRQDAAIASGDVSRHHALPTGEMASVQAAPAKPALPTSPAPDFHPSFVERLFRARPRSGVSDSSVPGAQSTPSGAMDANSLTPAPPKVKPGNSEDLAPNLLGRLFRFRPRAGVNSGLTTLGINPSIADAPGASARLPRTPAPEVMEEPSTCDRLFRPRPRGGVADPAVPLFEAIAPGVAEPASVAMLFPELPAVLMRQSRVAKEKPIRMKPRPTTQAVSPENEEFPETRSARQVS